MADTPTAPPTPPSSPWFLAAHPASIQAQGVHFATRPGDGASVASLTLTGAPAGQPDMTTAFARIRAAAEQALAGEDGVSLRALLAKLVTAREEAHAATEDLARIAEEQQTIDVLADGASEQLGRLAREVTLASRRHANAVALATAIDQPLDRASRRCGELVLQTAAAVIAQVRAEAQQQRSAALETIAPLLSPILSRIAAADAVLAALADAGKIAGVVTAGMVPAPTGAATGYGQANGQRLLAGHTGR